MVSIPQLETMTREQLRELAKARGVQLPRGNLSLPTLVALLKAAAAERKKEPRKRKGQ